MFAAVLVSALMRGRAGAPCACFGSRSTVGWRRCCATPAWPVLRRRSRRCRERSLTTERVAGLGIVVALLLCAGLGDRGAGAGPRGRDAAPAARPACSTRDPARRGREMGERSELIDRLPAADERALALAVFTSEGCRVCRGAKAGDRGARRPPGGGACRVFDEVATRAYGATAESPGSPFAIAARPGRNGLWPRGPSTTWPSSRASSPRPERRARARSSCARRARSGGEWIRIGEALDVAGGATHRGGACSPASAAGRWWPARAAAHRRQGGASRATARRLYHFCGHTSRAASCIHQRPGLPRVDSAWLPRPPGDGQADRQHRPARSTAGACRFTEDGELRCAIPTAAAAARAADQGLPGGPAGARVQGPARRAPGIAAAGERAQALRLLRAHEHADQR